MVDKGTARALVYGALGTLALILVIAIYAIATKSSVQAELDQQLEALQLKEAKLKQEAQRRAEAMAKFDEAQEAMVKKEEEVRDFRQQRDKYRDDLNGAQKKAESYDQESHLLRRKLWDKEDQARMEELEGMDEEKLKKELESEGEEFFKEVDELRHEDPGAEDKEDLEQEFKAAEAFKKNFLDTEKKLKQAGSEGDERALEDMQELGEQNEVYLDELERDAKKNGKKWKEGARPAKLNKLAHEMDLAAEALRKRYSEKRLKEEGAELEKIDKEAKAIPNDPIASEVDDVAHELEIDEDRLLRELEHGNDEEAEAAADKLEHDAEEDAVKVAKLEQDVEDSNLPAAEKQKRDALLKHLAAEVEKDEHEAQGVFRGLERQEVREDAVKMAKAINALAHQKTIKNLKHGQAVIDDVNGTLRKEGELLQVMKAGNDLEKEEQLGEELGEEADNLEDDAEKLYEEAEAGDFDDLDEKLLDEHLAKELLGSGAAMAHDAEAVDEADRERAVREAGEDLDEQAQHFGKAEKKDGGDELRSHAHAIEQEAEQLGRAVGEQAWDEEVKDAAKVFKDAVQLEAEAETMEKKVQQDKSLSEAERNEDIAALDQMEKDAKNLEHEADSVRKEVRLKIEHKNKAAQKQMQEADNIRKEAEKPIQG